MIDLKKLTLDEANKIADLGGRIGDIADITNYVPNLFCYGYVVAKSGNSVYLKGTTSVTTRRIYNGKISRYLKNGLKVVNNNTDSLTVISSLAGKHSSTNYDITIRIALHLNNKPRACLRHTLSFESS